MSLPPRRVWSWRHTGRRVTEVVSRCPICGEEARLATWRLDAGERTGACLECLTNLATDLENSDLEVASH